MLPSEVVWVVSFVVQEDGQLGDHTIEEFDLTQCSDTVAGHLRGMMGKGVFGSLADAELWAKGQTQRGCCCKQDGAGGGCPCSKEQG